MEYEVVIGLEVHSQLLTKSKMFCSCRADYQDTPPNTIVCEVCMGMPGTLPVVNRRALDLVIATGLALGCDILGVTKFDRKNYPYPDLMKGYQISQFDQPIATSGSVLIDSDCGYKCIGITRVHLEEDVARLLHRDGGKGADYSLMDVNRSGVPLMEIVSEPDMNTPEEARTYLTTLRSILRYIGASTANMEAGSFRCDANISIRPKGSNVLGTKVEVKNMNSFKSVYNALGYETKRQINAAQEDEEILQETRGWIEEKSITVSQRPKEGASDYRYFPEPDIPPIRIDHKWVKAVKESLPELPRARRDRFVEEYKLPTQDADLLTSHKPTSDFFEEVLNSDNQRANQRMEMAKSVSNWVLGDLTRLLNVTASDVSDVKITPKDFMSLLNMIKSGTLSTSLGRIVFEDMFESGDSPHEIVERNNLSQISDSDSIELAVNQAITDNPSPVSDYLSGKETAIQFLVGQVMKITKGKVNPQIASETLKDRLNNMR